MITDEEMDRALKLFWFKASEATMQEKRPDILRKLKLAKSAVYELQGHYETAIKQRGKPCS